MENSEDLEMDSPFAKHLHKNRIALCKNMQGSIEATVKHFTSHNIITETESADILKGITPYQKSHKLNEILKTRVGHLSQIIAYFELNKNSAENKKILENLKIFDSTVPHSSNNNDGCVASRSQRTKKEELSSKERIENLLETFNPSRPESYLRPKKKGYAVLIIHDRFDNYHWDRKGATKDQENISKVLTNFGFEVKLLQDRTKSNLEKKIWKCTNTLSGKYDSLIVVISSHGNQRNEFLTKDGQWVPYWSDIVEKFNCKSLQGKPKIFLFNFCRGDEVDGLVSVPENKKLKELPKKSDNEVDAVLPISSLSDTLICFSTLDRLVSLRNSQTGSWFIHYFSEVLSSDDHKNKDICKVLNIVAEKLKSEDLKIGRTNSQGIKESVWTKQMCCYYNIGFSKEFSFA